MQKKSPLQKLKIAAIVLGSVVLAALFIFFTPYFLANAHSTGWFHTARYAEANLYPELALAAYRACLDRFPRKNIAPQGTFVPEARQRMYALQEALTGIPFGRIALLLDQGDFAGVSTLAQGDALAVANLRVSLLSDAQRGELDSQIAEARAYLKRIVPIDDRDGGLVYSETATNLSITALRTLLSRQLEEYRNIIENNGIFFEDDRERIEKIFADDLARVTALEDGPGVFAAFETIRSALDNRARVLADLVQRKHVMRFRVLSKACVDASRNVNEISEISKKLHQRRNEIEVYLKGLASPDAVDKERLAQGAAALGGLLDTWKDELTAVISNATLLGQELGQPLEGLAALETILRDWERITPGKDLEPAARLFLTDLAALQAGKKRMQEQMAAAPEAARAELRRKVSAVNREVENLRFLPQLSSERERIENAALSFDGSITAVRNRFAAAGGNLDLVGSIQRLSDDYNKRIGVLLDRIHPAAAGGLVLGEGVFDAGKLEERINAQFEKVFRTIFVRNCEWIETQVESGEREKLDAFLAEAGYWENFDEAWLGANRWRLDYMAFSGGESDPATIKKMVDAIRNFPYFYDDDGSFGSRIETRNLNANLIKAAIKLLSSPQAGGLDPDLLKELAAYQG